MEILILVCALGITAPDCQAHSAIHSFHAPEPPADVAGCLRHGLMSPRSRAGAPGSYPKVVCGPPAGGAMATPSPSRIMAFADVSH